MSSERWRRIEDICHDALECAPDQRAAFVREACAGDGALRAEVESLLANQSRADALGTGLGIRDSGLDLIGKQIGVYRIDSLLGAGGMGEVYRAHDTRLRRDVAMKALPAAFSFDGDRRTRFEREARVLASLSHPNIGTIFGLEESNGATLLVLELIEGVTLADRIAKRPLPVAEALTIARQTADALDAAHEKGIVHRDLKPANVKLAPDGTVKVLDFGLATFARPQESDSSDMTATLATHQGAVVGTPSYMSPEQARGLAVDKRADIWAFGCVLYEMLTGRQAFAGQTPSDCIAAVIEREPDWSALPPSTPGHVKRVVRRCLEKEPSQRLRDIGDARHELAESSELVATVRWHRPWKWMAATGMVLAALGAALWFQPAQPALDSTRPIRFMLAPPRDHTAQGVAVPSPDGRLVVFRAAAANARPTLWVQSLDSETARQLPGTEDAQSPAWSPDGRHIVFGAGTSLKRMAVAEGPAQSIASISSGPLGATWNRNGVILFAPRNQAGLFQVSATDGSTAAVTQLDNTRAENSHRFPDFLPDGDHFLYTARSDSIANTGIYVGSLSTGTRKWLMTAQSGAKYAPPGFLLWVRDGTLMAQPFSLDKLELTGEAIAVASDVQQNKPSVLGAFAASADGSLISYTNARSVASRLVWYDRSGKAIGEPVAEGEFWQMRLDPSGRRAAVFVPSREDGSRDIWTIDTTTGVKTRITSSPSNDWYPVWSADGNQVLYLTEREGRAEFYRKRADGASDATLVWSTAGNAFLTDWSKDGRIAFDASPGLTTERIFDLWILNPGPSAQPQALFRSPFTESSGRFSPDGRWLAYESSESGQGEVYVHALDHPARTRISLNGGSQPIWTRDGKELLFIAPENRLMSARMTSDGTVAGLPAQLFVACDTADSVFQRFDVSPDGTRTLWVCSAPTAPSRMVFAAGWVPREPQ